MGMVRYAYARSAFYNVIPTNADVAHIPNAHAHTCVYTDVYSLSLCLTHTYIYAD
jgi:hypothetical protein